MIRLISGPTFFMKRVFPAMWFGFLGLWTFGVFAAALRGEHIPPPFFVMPFFMGGAGYLAHRFFAAALADEVFDCGDFLLVKKDGREERVPLANIRNVSYVPFMNPPRVTLSLRVPGVLGREIAFTPPKRFRLNPFASDPLVDELVERIDQARGYGRPSA